MRGLLILSGPWVIGNILLCVYIELLTTACGIDIAGSISGRNGFNNFITAARFRAKIPSQGATNYILHAFISHTSVEAEQRGRCLHHWPRSEIVALAANLVRGIAYSWLIQRDCCLQFTNKLNTTNRLSIECQIQVYFKPSCPYSADEAEHHPIPNQLIIKGTATMVKIRLHIPDQDFFLKLYGFSSSWWCFSMCR